MAVDAGLAASGAAEPQLGTGHIASAVISTHPAQANALAARIASLPETEVHAVVGGRIVVVMEGAHARALADRLDAIAALPEALAAAMVFEQALEPMDRA